MTYYSVVMSESGRAEGDKVRGSCFDKAGICLEKRIMEHIITIKVLEGTIIE